MAEKVEFYKETEFKDTEIGRIPKEWEVARFNNIINTLYGFAFVSEFFSEERGIPLIRIRDLGKNNTEAFYTGPYEEQYLVKRGDILVSMDGEFNVSLWRGPSGLLNQRVMKIWPRCEEKLDVLYLYYASQKTLKSFEDQIGATTVKHLLTDHLQLIKIPLPSLQEQQKIAEILSTFDESIQKTDDIIAKTERLKKGLMQELLTKGIGHREFKDTKIGKLPEEWEVRTLGEIGELSRGLSYRGHEKFAEEVSGSYLFLTLNSIKEGGGLKENGWSWIRTDRLRERHFVREGDIVIANTDLGMQRGHILGAPALVYFPSWYRKDRAIYSHHISKLQLKTKLHPQFFFYYLSYVQPMARKYYTGTGVWGLDIDAWSNELSISLPPLEEQQKIAEILSTVDEKVETLKLEKAKLERIKQWFMEELLSGRIRVRVA